ncbi:hypothetical protein CTE05_27990 [Cellulomonas terrae]|uniref:Uncharacterized protein n=1 Tax=Cellulomonas terrae TaxID=311234 RepID=A0A511JMK8_9CELL|nr:hypothetical protein CTE05_27990 [Cellulomonas terrae]
MRAELAALDGAALERGAGGGGEQGGDGQGHGGLLEDVRVTGSIMRQGGPVGVGEPRPEADIGLRRAAEVVTRAEGPR